MAVINGYASRDELKVWLSLDPSDSDFDDLLDKAINAASRGVDKCTRRHFYQVTETRYFSPVTRTFIDLGSYNDLVSVTTLATDNDGDGIYETEWDAADYGLFPRNPAAAPEPRPYRSVSAANPALRFTDPTSIEGVWGWPEIPDMIHEGTLLQAARLFKRREAPEGVVGLNMFGTVRMGRLDPDVRKLVNPYRIRGVG